MPHKKGTVALARPIDNPHGGNSEFFVNMVDNSATFGPDGASQGGYTVFGVVIKGDRFLKTYAWSAWPRLNIESKGLICCCCCCCCCCLALASLADRPTKLVGDGMYWLTEQVKITKAEVLRDPQG